METKSTEALYQELKEKDPRRALEIDPHNKRRLMRALEVIAALGEVPQQQKEECPYDVLLLGIQTERTELRERIRSRAKSAMTRGLVEETITLLRKPHLWEFWKPVQIPSQRLFEIGLQYREVAAWLEKEDRTETGLIKRLSEVNWQYAKRQLTWLKRDSGIEWFALEDRKMICERVKTFIG